jgi:hypothetical protein
MRRRVSLGATLVVLLACPAAATASGPQDSPFGGTLSVPGGVGATEAGKVQTRTLGALAVGLNPDPKLLAGGDGELTLSLVDQASVPTTIAGASVRVELPGSHRATSAQGVGWRCADDPGEVRCHATGTQTSTAFEPIVIALDARAPNGDATGKARARATWREDGSSYEAEDSQELTAQEGLAVKAASPAGADVLDAVPGVGDAAPIVLRGELGRFVDGIPVTYEWRQVGGPHVRWRGETDGSATDSVVNAQFERPEVDHPEKLDFELRATDWRGTARDRVTVRLEPQRVAVLPSGSFEVGHTDLPTAVEPSQELEQGVTRGLRFDGPALIGPLEGQATSLRVLGESGAARSVRWSVVSGPNVLRRQQRSRATVRFRAPPDDRPVVLRARARVAGVVKTKDVTIHSRARANARRPAAGRSAQDEGSKVSLCTYWDDPDGASITLEDGSKLVLGGSAKEGDACDADGAAIAFTQARLEVGSQRFDTVAGRLTGDGLAISSGWWSPIPALHLRVSVPGQGHLGASLTEGKWGALEGGVLLGGLGLGVAPLPSGWNWIDGKTTLTFKRGEPDLFLHTEADGPAQPEGEEANRGHLSIDGKVLRAGGVEVTVTAKNIATLQGSGEDAVNLSGEGSFKATKGKEGWETETPLELHADPEDKPLHLAENVDLVGLKGTYAEGGIEIEGEVQVRNGDDPNRTLKAAVKGRFKGRSDWYLVVQQGDPWTIADGVQVSGVCGSIQRRPFDPALDGPKATATATDPCTPDELPDPDKEDASGDVGDEKPADVLRVAIAGQVSGWKPSDQVRLTKAGALFTNRCLKDDKGCNPGQLRLQLNAEGKATIPDPDPAKPARQVDFKGQAMVNLKTLQSRFSTDIVLHNFGPAALGLRNVQIRFASAASWCVPKAQAQQTPPGPAPTPGGGDADTGAPLKADQKLTFGFKAEGVVMNSAYTALGELRGGDYCVAASFREFRPDALPGDAPQNLFQKAGAYYSSAATDINIAGETIALPGKQLKLVADFQVGTSVPKELQGPLAGTGKFSATLTKTDRGLAFAGTVAYNLTKPVWVVGGDPAANRFGLTGASLGINAAPGMFSLALSGSGVLETPPASGVPASSTPLRATAELSLGRGAQVSLAAAVDVSAVPGGQVVNAFGQQGLTVERLIVSASFGTTTAFGLAAKGTLPQRWVSSLGAAKDVPIDVALSLNVTTPSNSCVAVAVGDAKSTNRVLKLGPLEATYARVLVAPTGCTIGAGETSYTIKPGYALAFNGKVASTSVKFSAELNNDPAGFAMKANVQVGAFDVGPVSIKGTVLNLDIDRPKGKFAMQFTGGLEVGESSVNVAADIKATDTEFSGKLKGNGQLKLKGITFATGDVDAELKMSSGSNGAWRLETLKVLANTQMLGVSGQVQLSYGNGVVDEAAAAAELTSGVAVANVRIGALFAYKRDGGKLEGSNCNLRDSPLKPDPGGKTLFMRVCGGLTLGWLRKDVSFTLAFPVTWEFGFGFGKIEIPLGLVSVTMSFNLQGQLIIDPLSPKFTPTGGEATLGGCLKLIFYTTCGDAIRVTFDRNSGRFTGHFLGIPVRYGYDSWKYNPNQAQIAQPPIAPPQIPASEAVLRTPNFAYNTWDGLSGGSKTAHRTEGEKGGLVFDGLRDAVTAIWLPNRAKPGFRGVLVRLSDHQEGQGYEGWDSSQSGPLRPKGSMAFRVAEAWEIDPKTNAIVPDTYRKLAPVNCPAASVTFSAKDRFTDRYVINLEATGVGLRCPDRGASTWASQGLGTTFERLPKLIDMYTGSGFTAVRRDDILKPGPSPAPGPLPPVPAGRDLFLMLTQQPTGSGRIEVHADSGRTSYGTRIITRASTIPGGDANNGAYLMADMDNDGRSDLVFIKTRGTPNGRVELHWDRGSTAYQQRGGSLISTFESSDGNNGVFTVADMNADRKPELVFIKTRNTASGRVEVHWDVLGVNTAARAGGLVSTFSTTNAANGWWLIRDLDLDGKGDLVFVQTRETASGTAELHVDYMATSLQERGGDLETAYPLPDAGPGNGTFDMSDMDGDFRPDLVFIKTRNVPNNRVQVSYAPYQDAFERVSPTWTSTFSSAEAARGFFGMGVG